MSLVEKLNAGKPILTAWSGVPDALTVEIMARQGFDAVTLDMQHGGHNEDSVLRSLPSVLNSGRHALVRVPVGRFDMASRALDFGAEAVIAPMVNSVEDAERFAASMKYPPLGERSWGPTFAAPRHGSKDPVKWLHESNARTVSFAMVETHQAVTALDGILATPGIDGIFVGPGDFSIAWTKGETVNATLEAMMETVADIAKRTRAAGKHAGIYVTDPAIAGRFVKMGFQLLATGSEHQLIAAGAAGLVADLKKSIG